jgi:hypothetical protein
MILQRWRLSIIPRFEIAMKRPQNSYRREDWPVIPISVFSGMPRLAKALSTSGSAIKFQSNI